MEGVTQAYRAKKWLEIMRQCAESGMTKRDYCLEQCINEKTFYYWQRRLRDRLSSSLQGPQDADALPQAFVRVPFPANSIGSGGSRTAAIARVGSMAIGIQETAGEAFLTKLLRAAGHAG